MPSRQNKRNFLDDDDNRYLIIVKKKKQKKNSSDSDSFHFIAFTLNNSSHNSSQIRELNIKVKILSLTKL